jgi:hypothetical protein
VRESRKQGFVKSCEVECMDGAWSFPRADFSRVLQHHKLQIFVYRYLFTDICNYKYLFTDICNYKYLFADICNYKYLFADICNYKYLFADICNYKYLCVLQIPHIHNIFTHICEKIVQICVNLGNSCLTGSAP